MKPDSAIRTLFVFTLIAAVSFVSVLGVFADDDAKQGSVNENEWKLVWSDEFKGDQLDRSVWSRCERGRSDWNNTVSDRDDLVQVKDGVLRLTGIANNNTDEDPAPYLTGAITSKGRYAFQHGKVTIRARFKSAQGAWPALWMLGAEHGWPHGGEIDLMEHLNFDDIVYQTVHSNYTVNIDKTNTPQKSSTAPIERDEWNTYGCEWNEDRIVFTVNGEHGHVYPRVPEKGEEQWPFDQPFYFIFSMQIGGGWVNAQGDRPTIPEHYPAWMEVDWVRVYEPTNPDE